MSYFFSSNLRVECKLIGHVYFIDSLPRNGSIWKIEIKMLGNSLKVNEIQTFSFPSTLSSALFWHRQSHFLKAFELNVSRKNACDIQTLHLLDTIQVRFIRFILRNLQTASYFWWWLKINRVVEKAWCH